MVLIAVTLRHIHQSTVSSIACPASILTARVRPKGEDIVCAGLPVAMLRAAALRRALSVFGWSDVSHTSDTASDCGEETAEEGEMKYVAATVVEGVASHGPVFADCDFDSMTEELSSQSANPHERIDMKKTLLGNEDVRAVADRSRIGTDDYRNAVQLLGKVLHK